ncbi:hypothetical protein IAD21_01040 [Abditibacteriota bacterium]|nr:hypothetical protein IAD21_01040 [Abditibacteriota bacterium]
MLHTTRHSALRLLPLLPVLLAIGTRAHAQTVVTPPASAEGTVAVVPAGPTRSGAPVLIVAVVDTSGNADTAKKALNLAPKALAQTPGYSPVSASDYPSVSAALTKAATKDTDWSYPFTSTDYIKLGKVTKMTRAMTLSVTPAGDGYTAIAELYDTKMGVLTGYGRGTSAAGQTGDDALSSAIADAVRALGQTATIPGIVLAKPSMGGTYVARLSLGTLSGARGGARIEYLGDNGEPIAFGTLFDIAAGEGLATVAPEAAYPDIFVNQRVRLINNPIEKRALPTARQRDEKEFDKFEKNFAVLVGVGTAVYLIAK